MRASLENMLNKESADASPTMRCLYPNQWHEINWLKINRKVRRLQARIVKAAKAKKWHKVRNLIRLLSHSLAAKCLAIKRVTENKGKRTAGVDGEKWTKSSQKVQALKRISYRGYKPNPLRRIKIPKDKGWRKLGIPSMLDRAIQTSYLQALEPLAEVLADKVSYGFRRQRSCHDAITRVFLLLSKKTSPKYILDADIQSCFDEICHLWLVKHIPMDKRLLNSWLKAGVIESGKFFPTLKGTPQGGIISPVLANMTLDGLDDCLRKTFPARKGHKVNLCRYADDIVVTGLSKELLENEVIPVIQSFLAERGLELSLAKTRVVHISEGFDFLGKTFRFSKGKLKVIPSKHAVKKLKLKLKGIIKSSGHLTAHQLACRLNLVLRGWALYHRHTYGKRVFGSIDYWLSARLYKWARYRHKNKKVSWVLDNYFVRYTFRDKVFFAIDPDSGKQRRLYRLASTSIITHRLIRGEANPFDLDYEYYFESRASILATAINNYRQRQLFSKQSGLCASCQAPLLPDEVWHVHHLVPKTLGGSDQISNLSLLHATCHVQVHSTSTCSGEA